MIAAYRVEAERLNEGNAFRGEGLRSRCSELQANLLATGEGLGPQSRLLLGFRMPMVDGFRPHNSVQYDEAAKAVGAVDPPGSLTSRWAPIVRGHGPGQGPLP